jgi:hypothetical protein
MSKGDSIQFSALSVDIKKPIPGQAKMGFSVLEDGTIGLSGARYPLRFGERHQRLTETH